MTPNADAAVTLSEIVRARRSVRDFLTDEIPPALLNAVLEDANWSPSWSNTQPYRIAIASGDLKEQLKRELCARFDAGIEALDAGMIGKLKMLWTRDGIPDGDFPTNFDYPNDLLPRRRATGFGLYQLLGIARNDKAARNRQLRRNFEFFGAPTALFIFVHKDLGAFSVLDAGIFLQTLMLSAHEHGLATCAEGALATWAGPVKQAFEVPKDYKLICGLSIGYASGQAVNQFNPGRGKVAELLIGRRRA
jgi:nitroreductase